MKSYKWLIKTPLKLAFRLTEPLLARLERRFAARVIGELDDYLKAVRQKLSDGQDQHLAAMGEVNVALENIARELLRLQMQIELLPQFGPDDLETVDGAGRIGSPTGPPRASSPWHCRIT